MRRPPLATVLLAGSCFAWPVAAQTVIYPDPPPRADSARPPAAAAGTAPAPRDTATRAGGRDTTQAAPVGTGTKPATLPATVTPPPGAAAAQGAVDPVLQRLCKEVAPGEAAPDVLGIVFESGSDSTVREAALAAVSGKRLGGTVEDQFQYVQVPAGGNEFRLRVLADKVIRLRAVSEVGPVACPALPAQPSPPSSRPDST